MADRRLRKRIAFEAAWLLRSGEVVDYPIAKRKAARKLGLRFRPDDLPSNREIRQQLDRIEALIDADRTEYDSRSAQLILLRMMRQLRAFQPRLVHAEDLNRIHETGRVQLALKAASLLALTTTLDEHHRQYEVRQGSVSSLGEPMHVMVEGPISFVLIPWEGAASNGHQPVIDEEELTRRLLDDPGTDLDAELEGLARDSDRFEVYYMLLHQLEEVDQDPQAHPEGDALYHSLQVFDLAAKERPYDEELLTAALLHDVGKTINRHDPNAATRDLLEGLITHRTSWLIEHFPDAPSLNARGLPQASHEIGDARQAHDDLMLLWDCNRKGRQSGVTTSSLDEAVEYLRQLDQGELWH